MLASFATKRQKPLLVCYWRRVRDTPLEHQQEQETKKGVGRAPPSSDIKREVRDTPEVRQ